MSTPITDFAARSCNGTVPRPLQITCEQLEKKFYSLTLERDQLSAAISEIEGQTAATLLKMQETNSSLRAEVKRLRTLQGATDVLRDIAIENESGLSIVGAYGRWQVRALDAEAKLDKYLAALHQCYAETGEEAGDIDDFRALVDHEKHTVEAVKNQRKELDRLYLNIATIT